jgi:flagellar M-ring protein FliF
MSALTVSNNEREAVLLYPLHPDMDNALATTAPNTLVPAAAGAMVPTLAQRWRELPTRTQTLALLGGAALLAVLVGMAINAKDSDYRPLRSNLSEKEGGAVTDRLTQMNVPYKISAGGSTILVPASQVGELRLKLAAQGLLPSSAGAVPGYDLLEKNSFGQTQGQEQMNFKRATEGELTTTIQSMDGIKAARVMLALPAQNGFFREQQKPSASVVLTLYPGRTLDRKQLAGIVQVVSSGVPEMNPKAVTVTDQTGGLLTRPNEDDQGLDDQQLQFRREVEAQNLKRVMDLLEPVVGRDNVRATVSADIDFSQVMQTAEAYRPNQGADAKAAVRELRTEEANQASSATPTGVPGAASNQPPVPASAPINGPAQALQAANGGTGGANLRREAATRFEVDKTTTVTRNATGQVRRLNVGVVVNHRTTTDAKGKSVTAALPDKEIEQLTALVQQGIGFNSERGDVVKVVNAPFRKEVAPVPEDVPIWKQEGLIDLLKTALAPGALALVALAIIFKLIRPALVAMLAPPPPPEEPAAGAQLSEVVADEAETLDAEAKLLRETQLNRLENARAMARSNPAAVAHIVRGWVNGDAPAA